MTDEDRRPKRSRFDQTEPEPKRASRFDRRSRSPVPRHSESRRSRSPLSREPKEPHSPSADGRRSASGDPTAAAAAAAARINASLQAKKIQHVDVPPIRSVSLNNFLHSGSIMTIDPQTQSPVTKPASTSSGQSISNINGDVYIADGDYIKDIEVNDLRNRYTLTKGSTQKMIKEDTGADVTTRGNYYPDKSMATAANPPLYLHVTSTSKAGLEAAIAKIEELMKQELPNLVDERRFRRREPEQFERDEFGRRKWPEERIQINLEPLPGFNLRAQVVGQGGMYVKHIQQETRCRVQIKGRGSGFKEHSTQIESDDPMYLHVAGPDAADVQKAKDLCLDLLDNVRVEYDKFKANPPQQQPYGYGNGSYQSRDRPSYNSYGSYGGAQSPTAPPGASMSPTTPAPPPGIGGAPGAAGTSSDWAAQYAQYYGGQDPYAAYGGYQAYAAQYYQYYQQQATQQGQTPPPPPPSSDAPPPPPSGAPPGTSSNPPPPPPPGAPGAGSYSAVPPPPGM